MENLVNLSLLGLYKGKRIFITGHTGFKGSWLTQILINADAVIRGYSLEPNTTPNLFNLLNLESQIENQFGNINDFEQLKQSVLEFKPDFIFHLAAQPLVRYSYMNTLETYQTNIMGTANLLEVCKELNQPCVVVCVTTDKVYLNIEKQYAYVEDDKLGGYDPYSSSKAAAELIIDSYRKSFFSSGNIQVASARAGNVIGGGDWSADRLVPDLVRSINSQKKIQIRNPNSVRPWQHVLEPLSGYLLLGKSMFHHPHKYCESFNFGPNVGDEKSVRELASIFYQIYDKEDDMHLDANSNFHEANLLMLNIQKANSILNWHPKYSTNTAIELTAKWYMNFNSGNVKELVNENINSYFSHEF